MGSNRVIISLEQHVDVLGVQDNRVELVNFTLATNRIVRQMTVDSIVHRHCDSDTASIRLPVRMIIMHHARLLQAPAEC